MILTVMLIIIILGTLFTKCNGLKTYIVKSPATATPHTLILASTHGNEPAGYHALFEFIKSNPTIGQGKLTLIPVVNTCGLMLNQRKHPLGNFDINRKYPNKTFINSQITKYIDKADWVIDLHEGWGFHHLNKDSVGSGIYPGTTSAATKLSLDVVKQINTTISTPYKKFVTGKIPNVPGSLRDYCNQKNKHYILVETSGINDIQPLQTRVQQQMFIIKNIVNYLHNK